MDLLPWLKNQWDRVAALVAMVLGLVCLVLGWLGVRDVSLPAEQIPYLASGAVFGLFALGVAATLWLSADLRDVWRTLENIQQSTQPDGTEKTEPPPSESPAADGANEVNLGYNTGPQRQSRPARVGG